MNHLHWPRALLHSDDAATDLARCIEFQRKSESAGPENYFVRTYVALGDTFAKAKEYDRAREAWRQGTKLFAASPELKERLSITDNSALLKYVESKRSLEQPIDTGLSFLDPTP
jgi:tetratricopeptide (TPR) repeat protein